MTILENWETFTKLEIGVFAIPVFVGDGL